MTDAVDVAADEKPVPKANPFSRKRPLRQQANQEIQDVEPEHQAVSVEVASSSPPLPSARATSATQTKPAKPTAFEILDAAAAATPLSRPQTPAHSNAAASGVVVQQMSAVDRSTIRGAVDEKVLYSGYRSQLEKWIALAHIGRNYVATAVHAETAVDFARAEQPQ